MMKWLKRIIWIPVFVIAVWFMAANRTPASISLDAFRPDNPALSTPAFPLWIWLMLMLFVGVGLGAAGQWLSGHERRSQARDNRRELKLVKQELSVMKAKAENPGTARASDNDDIPKLEATNV